MPPLPAHQTKNERLLDYELWPTGRRVIIAQDDSAGDTTGTTVWLGAQILSVYLQDVLKSKKPYKLVDGVKQRYKAIELGAGTGLLSLSLHAMGYDVVATDTPLIAHGILHSNLSSNRSTALSAPILEARALDWFSPPSSWSWTTSPITPSLSSSPSPSHEAPLLQPPFDLILTTDSIYSPTLSTPLLRTLHALSPLSPPIYLSLEVRDPSLIDEFLESARTEWGFKCSKVEKGRLERLVRGMGWEEEDWEGVEVWKLKWGAGRKR